MTMFRENHNGPAASMYVNEDYGTDFNVGETVSFWNRKDNTTYCGVIFEVSKLKAIVSAAGYSFVVDKKYLWHGEETDHARSARPSVESPTTRRTRA